jgi:hypothetical protein
MKQKTATIDWTTEYKTERTRLKKSPHPYERLYDFLLLITIPVLTSIVSFLINLLEFSLDRVSHGCLFELCFDFGTYKFMWKLFTRLVYAVLAAYLCLDQK